MSDRRKVNRDDQRRARVLVQQRGISYMQALDVVRQDGAALPSASAPNTAVTGWLKSLHHRHDGWTIQPGAKAWVSDISRHDRTGARVRRKDGTPWGEPSWNVGDRVGLYFAGTFRVPVLVEVIARPRFDPDFVQKYNDGQESDAGERWPWVTEVRGVLAVALAQAPTLDEIDVAHASMRQRSRLLLSPESLRELEKRLL